MKHTVASSQMSPATKGLPESNTFGLIALAFMVFGDLATTTLLSHLSR